MNHEDLHYEYLLQPESPAAEEFFSKVLIPLSPPSGLGIHRDKKNLLFISGPNELDEVYRTNDRDACQVNGPEDLPLALGLGFRRDRTFQKTPDGFSIHYAAHDGHDLGELAFDGKSVRLNQNLLDPNLAELYIWITGSEIPRLCGAAAPLPSAWNNHFQGRLSKFGNVLFRTDHEYDIHFSSYPAILLVSGLIPIRIESLDRLVDLLRDLAFYPFRTFQMPAVSLRLYFQAVNYVLGWPERLDEDEICQAAAANEIAAGVVPYEWPRLETGVDGSKAITCRRLLPVMGFAACLRDIEPFIEKLASGGFVTTERLPCPDFLNESRNSNIQTEVHSWSTLPLATHIARFPLIFLPKIKIESAKEKVVIHYFCTPLDLNEAKSTFMFPTPEDYGRALALTKIWKAQCLTLREEARKVFMKQINSRIKNGGCHEIQ